MMTLRRLSIKIFLVFLLRVTTGLANNRTTPDSTLASGNDASVSSVSFVDGLCETDFAFHKKTLECYELNTPGPCGENMKFYTVTWPSAAYGDCFCDRSQPGVYNSTTKKCHILFHKDYCGDGFWLQLNGFGNLECHSNPCIETSPPLKSQFPNSFVLINGLCARLGEECGIGAAIGFRIGSFEPECIKDVNIPRPRPTISPSSTVAPTIKRLPCRNGTLWSPVTKTCEIIPENFRVVALVTTNEYRLLHQAPLLAQDNTLDQVAQAYAEKLARENSFVHSMDKRYGENLYYYMGPQISNSELISDAVKAWYDEVKDYDYNLPLFSSNTAHFTQLVWKTSTRQGVGVATNPKSKYSVVVVNYSPPGNWEGEFFENVRRPLSPDGGSYESNDDLFTIY